MDKGSSLTGMPCKCCKGQGTQVRATDGLTVLCPCCNGSGTDVPAQPKITW